MKIKIAMLLILILTCGSSLLAHGETRPKIYLNDTRVDIKERLGKVYINDKGVTMVPLEGFMRYFGGEIDELGDRNQIKITKGAYEMVFTPDVAYYERNGFKIPLGEKVVVYDDYFHVPLRRLMETLGRQVIWNPELNSVQVLSSDQDIEHIKEVLKDIESLEWSGSYKEGKIDFSFSEEQIVDYYKLFKVDENWNPLPINGVIFHESSDYYRPGYLDVSHIKKETILYYKVKAIIEGVESEYSKYIEVYIK